MPNMLVAPTNRGHSGLPDHTDDPLALTAIDHYFHLYYWTRGNHDSKGILQELTGRGTAQIQFKSAADKFSLIDLPTTPVIIPRGKNGATLCARLRIAEEPWQIRYLARRLQRYTVNVWPGQYRRLVDDRKLETWHDKIYVLTDMSLYSETIGLLHQDGSDDEMQEIA